MRTAESALREVRAGTYVAVWIILLVLTALTVTVARLHLTRFAVALAILIATMKGSLVLTYFMHLREEPWILKAMLFIALLALTLIIALTFADVLYR
jgi:cytochrome c oxidase subunit 4